MVEPKEGASAENEARTKAIEKAGVPKEIRKSYHVSIECGSAHLTKKSRRK